MFGREEWLGEGTMSKGDAGDTGCAGWEGGNVVKECKLQLSDCADRLAGQTVLGYLDFQLRGQRIGQNNALARNDRNNATAQLQHKIITHFTQRLAEYSKL